MSLKHQSPLTAKALLQFIIPMSFACLHAQDVDPDPGETAPEGGIDDWASVLDFENGEHGLNTAPVTSAQVVDDPVEGAANRVLRIRSAGSDILNAYLAIPEIPDQDFGTVFFRFLITDENHKANFGLSGASNPNSTTDLQIRLRSGDENSSPSELEVLDDGVFEPAVPLAPQQWYSIWMVMDTEEDVWNLHLQGGAISSPTLIRSQIPLNGADDSSLQSFFWQLAPGSNIETTSAVYFDDLQIDIGNANTSSPVCMRWHLVDDFEGDNPLASWQIPNAASQSNSVLTEEDGNRYLARAASSSEASNPLAIASLELPFASEVGQSVTLFMRIRFDGNDFLQSFGLSAFNPPDPSAYTEEILAPQLQLSPTGAFHLYDGLPGADDFVPADPAALESGLWYKLWLVCNNRGTAVGGQRWQAWIKGGPYLEATPLESELFFRDRAEAPLTHFLSFASSLNAAQNDPLRLDDLYLFPTATLTDPLAPSPISTRIDSITPDQVSITGATSPNRLVRLFASPDLKNWSPTGDFKEGNGSDVVFSLPINGPRGFFHAREESPRQFVETSWSTNFRGPGLPRGLQTSPGSTWTHETNLLTLVTPAPQVPGMIRRPGAYALVPGEWRNPDLTIEARTLMPDSVPRRDVCLIFGYQDETHFYYAHLSSQSDGSFHNIIMKVDGTDRQTIHTPSRPSPSIGSEWHRIRLTHSTNGAIAVYIDDESHPRMQAQDSDFRSGRIGFGSFDDAAEFRSFAIRGQSR